MWERSISGNTPSDCSDCWPADYVWLLMGAPHVWQQAQCQLQQQALALTLQTRLHERIAACLCRVRRPTAFAIECAQSARWHASRTRSMYVGACAPPSLAGGTALLDTLDAYVRWKLGRAVHAMVELSSRRRPCRGLVGPLVQPPRLARGVGTCACACYVACMRLPEQAPTDRNISRPARVGSCSLRAVAVVLKTCDVFCAPRLGPRRITWTTTAR